MSRHARQRVKNAPCTPRRAVESLSFLDNLSLGNFFQKTQIFFRARFVRALVASVFLSRGFRVVLLGKVAGTRQKHTRNATLPCRVGDLQSLAIRIPGINPMPLMAKPYNKQPGASSGVSREPSAAWWR